MRKKYDARIIKSYRSYKIADLCRLFRDNNLHAQTIRGWIHKENLNHILDGKTIYIYGAVFKQFVIDRNKANKRTLKFTEFRCGKCKNFSKPYENKITKLEISKIGCLIAYGKCPVCEHSFHRNYKKIHHQNVLNSFEVIIDRVALLYDSLNSTSTTNIKPKSETALCEPIPETSIKTSHPTNKTNINHHQLSLL